MINYKKSYTYNNTQNIYDLGSMADYLKKASNPSNTLTDQLKETKSSYIVIYNKDSNNYCQNIDLQDKSMCQTLGEAMELKFMILTKSDTSTLKTSLQNDGNLSQEMKDFIKRLNTTKIENKGRFIAEFENGNFATIAFDQNINSSNKTIFSNILNNIVTSGDGLYKDNETRDRYIYKGTNPNNYMTFSESTWRILSIEADNSIKIIKNEPLNRQMTWDDNTNSWNQATIQKYLNSEFINSLKQNDKIIEHDFNIETPNSKINWKGKVGLLSPSEYLAANTDNENSNYLYISRKNWWLLGQNSTNLIPYVNSEGNIDNILLNNSLDVRPVIYILPSEITGSGTSEDPYIIK